MKIVVDESVSFGVAIYLRSQGHDVIAIAEATTSGLKFPYILEIKTGFFEIKCKNTLTNFIK